VLAFEDGEVAGVVANQRDLNAAKCNRQRREDEADWRWRQDEWQRQAGYEEAEGQAGAPEVVRVVAVQQSRREDRPAQFGVSAVGLSNGDHQPGSKNSPNS